MKELFRPTSVMSHDSKKSKLIFTILVCWVVIGQLLCASGSGPSTGADPVSGWIHTAMNIANVIIALLVLTPKTRALGAMLSTMILLVSMSANWTFYGFAYFLKLSPFDLAFFIPSIVVFMHYRPDLAQTFRRTS
jgi:hypothetical protein